MTASRIVGDRSLLVEVAEPAAAAHWLRDAARREEIEVVDIVPAACTVLVTAPTTAARGALWRLTEQLPEDVTATNTDEAEAARIPVQFDGPDLDRIADHAEIGVDGVVRMLVNAELRVQFCGFSPGFAYLTGVPEALRLPRRDEPRSRVPAGSLALADEYAAIYPRESPGGWHLVGTTGSVMFDITRDPPALLTAGRQVRLEQQM